MRAALALLLPLRGLAVELLAVPWSLTAAPLLPRSAAQWP
jgi:hypothetical protein